LFPGHLKIVIIDFPGAPCVYLWAKVMG